jgi:two-component system, NarL family, nitrate/nitrite response regulator NarL
MGVGDCGVIAVVDDDGAMHTTAASIAARLGYELAGVEAAEDLLAELRGRRPALAIIAVVLPGVASGLELMQDLHERFGNDLPVILVSAERTTTLDRVAGLMLGADDYLVKPVDPGELGARVRRSLRRSKWAAQNGNGTPSEVSLSPRERQILALLADGQTQAQIASALVLSPKTVSTHIQHLLTKLGVHSRAQAVAAAFKLGLVGDEVEGHAMDTHVLPAI